MIFPASIAQSRTGRNFLNHRSHLKRGQGICIDYHASFCGENLRMVRGTKNMTHQHAIEYFFDRIRGQILTALANPWRC